VISMKVAQKGYCIRYDKEAFAMELPSFSLQDEQKRKIRIAAGGFQAIGLLGPSFYFWKHPRLTYLYVSHRVLRWAVTPFCLLLCMVSNLLLLLQSAGAVYTILFALQLAFYGAGLIARLSSEGTRLPKPVKLCYYFIFMNVS